jgi:DNA-binding response OmpR family regulator
MGLQRGVMEVTPEQATSTLFLLVEDDDALALRLGERLREHHGSQVIVATDCVTALKFLQLCKPDLILLDERLLTHDGIDLLPRLQVMKDLQDIPLLLLSMSGVGEMTPTFLMSFGEPFPLDIASLFPLW